MPNEFGYLGNYAEEEEESGYDEFALRTYVPITSCWLSTDPYDQFASPYISMGNDLVKSPEYSFWKETAKFDSMKSNRNFKTIALIFLTIAFISFALPTKKKIKIWIIGDSTAANKLPKAYPETGWGMKFQPFFDSNYVVVDNRALNGRSTLSFRNEGRWAPVYDSMQPGDYVFIEFGHNDEKVENPNTGVNHEIFKANLARYVLETREKSGIPILLTPIARRIFKDGQLQNTHKGYPDVVRSLADSLKVPLIDMEMKTSALLTSYGDEGSKQLFNYVDSGNVNYPKGVKDNTHLSPMGADKVAGLAVQGIKELKLNLAKFMINK